MSDLVLLFEGSRLNEGENRPSELGKATALTEEGFRA